MNKAILKVLLICSIVVPAQILSASSCGGCCPVSSGSSSSCNTVLRDSECECDCCECCDCQECECDCCECCDCQECECDCCECCDCQECECDCCDCGDEPCCR